ncbi:SRPBCC family protein [Methanothrix sp.]|uniref:SRPBCC family protein n=1 Tax=Methanothrix sp. TaxID=90426 RepID=UPI003BB7FA51
MSKLIARAALGVLILLAILYIAMLVAANTSITQRTIQTEVTINATASKVWQVLTDFEAYPQWNPFIRQIDGAIQPGQQLIIELNLSGRTMTINPTVLVMQPERELRWLGRFSIPGIFDGEHSLNIEPLGANRVRFIQSETFRGILVPFSGAILNDTEQSFQEMNQALREHAEQAR